MEIAKTMKGSMISAVAAGVVLACVSPAGAVDTNLVRLEAKGCKQCLVAVGGINPSDAYDSFTKNVQLRKGRGTALVPARFSSLQLSVYTRKGWSGGGGATIIVPQYQHYFAGEKISNKESRYSSKARLCFPNVDPEQLIRFTAVRDPGDPGPRPSRKDDPGGHDYWTPFVVRAWASPTVEGVGRWGRVRNGQAAAQNTVCGLP